MYLPQSSSHRPESERLPPLSSTGQVRVLVVGDSGERTLQCNPFDRGFFVTEGQMCEAPHIWPSEVHFSGITPCWARFGSARACSYVQVARTRNCALGWRLAAPPSFSHAPSGVGKSSIVHLITQGEPTRNPPRTVGCNVSLKVIRSLLKKAAFCYSSTLW